LNPTPPQPQAQAPQPTPQVGVQPPQMQQAAPPKPQQQQKPQPVPGGWSRQTRIPTTEAATAAPKFADGGGFMNESEDLGMPPEGAGLMAPQFDGQMEDLPPGSLPHEVADNVEALMSEGEWVMPADAVRWHGVKTLMGMRDEAKAGFQALEAEGMVKKPAGAVEAGPEALPPGLMGDPLPPMDEGLEGGLMGLPEPPMEEPLRFNEGGEAGGEANDNSGSQGDGGNGATGGDNSPSGMDGFGGLDQAMGGWDNVTGGFSDVTGTTPDQGPAVMGWTNTPLAALDEVELADTRYSAMPTTSYGWSDIGKDLMEGNIGRGLVGGLASVVGSPFGLGPATAMDPITGEMVDVATFDPAGVVGGRAGGFLGGALGTAVAGPLGGAIGSTLGSKAGGSLGRGLDLGMVGTPSDAPSLSQENNGFMRYG
jgi:hypothetical protein